MMYLLISNALIVLCFAFYIYKSEKEKSRLVDMLAAKDYADFKNFETRPTEEKKNRRNMFKVRENQENRFKEQE